MRVRRHTSTARIIWAPSLARRVLRRRVVWLGAAIVVGIAASVALSSQVAAVQHERDRWGSSQSVPIVTQPIGIGEPLSGKYEFRELPQAVVPASVVTEIASGARAKVPLYPGDIVVSPRVATGADQLPAGTGALTLRVVSQVKLIDPGDLVDLWTVDSANLSSHRVAQHVLVLAVEDDSITVAIDQQDIAQATVASLRPVTVVLVG